MGVKGDERGVGSKQQQARKKMNVEKWLEAAEKRLASGTHLIRESLFALTVRFVIESSPNAFSSSSVLPAVGRR